eukprot:m.207946 g.207946  ORF g.207946 m.207946 type:complete len:58 (-) comp17125_c2_seq2:2660-2833(-)
MTLKTKLSAYFTCTSLNASSLNSPKPQQFEAAELTISWCSSTQLCQLLNASSEAQYT